MPGKKLVPLYKEKSLEVRTNMLKEPLGDAEKLTQLSNLILAPNSHVIIEKSGTMSNGKFVTVKIVYPNA